MWSDSETRDDCLGFTNYVETLCGVCLEPGLAPLTLGIFGSWGSGKTSLMRMLQATLTSEPKTTTLWFNAWQYDGAEELQPALISAILNKLDQTPGIVQQAKLAIQKAKKNVNVLRLSGAIAKSVVTMTPDIDGLVSSFEKATDSTAITMFTFERDFSDALKATGIARVVVLIDDLDRCRSDQVISAFETIKLFLNIPECTFVIGADSDKIQHAIEVEYRAQVGSVEKFSEDYLEKIVQLPFKIPEQQLPDIACYVGMLSLKPILNDVGWNALVGHRATLMAEAGSVEDKLRAWIVANEAFFSVTSDDAARLLTSIIQYVPLLARGLRGNPRQIKRFLNIAQLRLRLAEKNNLKIDHQVLAKLLVVEYTFGEMFHDLVTTYDPETGRSELLASLVTDGPPDKSELEQSPALQRATESPRLLDLLKSEPRVDGTTDLAPYLFLAQTALGPGATSAIETPEEAVTSIVNRIASEDAIKSRAGARLLLVKSPEFVPEVVRSLATRVRSEKDVRVQNNIVIGLAEICGKHVSQLSVALDPFRIPDIENIETLAPSIVKLLDIAIASGDQTLGDLRGSYVSKSPIAKALARGRTQARR